VGDDAAIYKHNPPLTPKTPIGGILFAAA
jgi:hypothetical protein